MILILGASGQVGQSLKILKPKNIKTKFLTKKDCNITNTNALKSYLKKFKPKYVINTAAYTDVSRAEHNKNIAKKINAQSVKNLSILSNEYNFILLHISTDYVFNGRIKTKYNELHKPIPKTIYGESKLLGENYIIRNSKKFIIIRTSGVFSHFKSSFVHKILIKSKDYKDILVVSDQLCFPTYSFDLARLIWDITLDNNKLKLNEIYHYTGHEIPLSWYNFAKKIFIYAKKYNNFLPKIKPIKSMDIKDSVKRPINSCLCNNKINSYIRVKANINKNIKESVDLFYRYKA